MRETRIRERECEGRKTWNVCDVNYLFLSSISILSPLFMLFFFNATIFSIHCTISFQNDRILSVGLDAETGGNTLVGFNHSRPTVWRVYSRKKIKRKGWNGNL